jgi:hypothetical protein
VNSVGRADHPVVLRSYASQVWKADCHSMITKRNAIPKVVHTWSGSPRETKKRETSMIAIVASGLVTIVEECDSKGYAVLVQDSEQPTNVYTLVR